MNPDDEIPAGVTLRDFDDHEALRKNIFDGVKSEFGNVFPQSYGGVRLEVHDMDYADPEHVTLSEQKEHLLKDKFLSRRLRGTVRLVDDKTNEVLDQKPLSLLRVPYLTDRGTFVHGGNEYTSINQARLMPGAYTRRQNNGGIETQMNVKSGTGSAFRVGFEPETSQYRLRVGQANLHLFSLLIDLGVPEPHIERMWGPEITAANKKKYDPRVLDKAYDRFVPKSLRVPEDDRDTRIQKIKEALDAAKVRESVLRRTLPNFFDMTKAATWKEAAGHARVTELFDKRATDSVEFAPAYKPDDLRAHMNDLVGKVGPNLGGDRSWNKQWLEWYTGWFAGTRTNEDETQKNRWKQIYRLHGSKFKKDPTPRRAMMLKAWAINPFKLIPESKHESLAEAIKNYEDKAYEGHEHLKSASAPEDVATPVGLWLMEKCARYGAGVLFKQPNGKYLLEKNYDDGNLPEHLLGKLRPAGGGKSKRDANLRQTILREMREEFGLHPDDTSEKIKLLGYIDDGGDYDGCALFEVEDHGLKPGTYQASNSKDEKVILVEAELKHPDYIGAMPKDLRPYSRKDYKPEVDPWKGPEWTGFDLDRTLAHREDGQPLEEIGVPIPAAVKLLKKHIADGDVVKIFTARATSRAQRSLVKRWLARHGLPELEVTNVKDPACIRIYDDIARQVEPNTGKVVKAAAEIPNEAEHPGDAEIKKKHQDRAITDTIGALGTAGLLGGVALVTHPPGLPGPNFNKAIDRYTTIKQSEPESWDPDFNPDNLISEHVDLGSRAMQSTLYGQPLINHIHRLRSAISQAHPGAQWGWDDHKFVKAPPEILKDLDLKSPVVRSYMQFDPKGNPIGVQENALHYLAFQAGPITGYKQLWNEYSPQDLPELDKTLDEWKFWSKHSPGGFDTTHEHQFFTPFNDYVKLFHPELAARKALIEPGMRRDIRETSKVYSAFGKTVQDVTTAGPRMAGAAAMLAGAGGLAYWLYKRNHDKHKALEEPEADKQASLSDWMRDALGVKPKGTCPCGGAVLMIAAHRHPHHNAKCNDCDAITLDPDFPQPPPDGWKEHKQEDQEHYEKYARSHHERTRYEECGHESTCRCSAPKTLVVKPGLCDACRLGIRKPKVSEYTVSKATLSAFDKALEASDVAENIQFYVNAVKDHCDVCTGDWHTEEEAQAARKLAEQYFKTVDVEAEIGKPSGCTHVYQHTLGIRKPKVSEYTVSKATLSAFDKALEASDVAENIQFYVNAVKDHCDVCTGDWHTEEEAQAARKLAEQYFKTVDVEAEIGKPSGCTHVYQHTR